jgi:hypothetical protein
MPSIVSAIDCAAGITVTAPPMIGIPCIMTIANDHLVMTAAITGIMIPVVCIAHPWITLVNNYFISIVHIISAVPCGQKPAVYPNIVFEINIIMGWYIIVGVNIGHVIVINMIVAYGAPIGLAAYVDTQTNTNLCRSYFYCEAA